MAEHVHKEYISPAYMKFLGAGRHFGSLERDILEWTEHNQLLAPARPVLDEINTYELFLPGAPFVPLMEWSSRFGDGVHNLRASLDLLAFELCHIDGDVPGKPRQVSFPVVEQQSDWTKQTKYLDSIPASLLQRIQAVQPWHVQDAGAHVLTLVTALDNMDKHRSIVGMIVLPGKLDPPRLLPMPTTSKTAATWQNPWFRFTLDGPLADVHWPVLWHVDPAPMIYFEGRMTFLGHLQPWLFQEIKRIFQFIASGKWPVIDNPHPEPEWVDMPA
ncbi:hypothetical protein [Specibacter sp. RAF43]|uniref:hypothetical protein n=1 Tax=Specibacter sp. RAF43 TaxID=3233057 RepID=UPI003F94E3A4